MPNWWDFLPIFKRPWIKRFNLVVAQNFFFILARAHLQRQWQRKVKKEKKTKHLSLLMVLIEINIDIDWKMTNRYSSKAKSDRNVKKPLFILSISLCVYLAFRWNEFILITDPKTRSQSKRMSFFKSHFFRSLSLALVEASSISESISWCVYVYRSELSTEDAP